MHNRVIQEQLDRIENKTELLEKAFESDIIKQLKRIETRLAHIEELLNIDTDKLEEARDDIVESNQALEDIAGAISNATPKD